MSVVVGVMNGAPTIERCIDSVAAQTFESRELIIKDGGSTDGTVAILEKRTSSIDYWVSCPDQGLYDAWNTALQQCRGKWICFLGCDDEFADASSLAQLVQRTLTPDPPDLVSALAAVTGSSGRFVRVIGRPWCWAEMKRTQVVAHPGMLHRAELFRRHGTFDTRFRIVGDYEFLLRLGPETRAEFIDQVTVRMGAHGMSHENATQAFAENWKVQANHPEIGAAAATVNYGVAVAKLVARRILGRS